MAKRKHASYGVLAEFAESDQLIAAAKKAKEAGYSRMDAFSPFPIHGLADIMEFRDVRVKWVMFVAGLIGACSGFLLQAYTNAFDYPLNVGGKPLISTPSMVPVIFECTVLFSALSGVLAMFAFNGLPQPYHPVFSVPGFDRASQDRFYLAIEAIDPKYSEDELIEFFKGINAISVCVAKEEE